MMSSVELIAAHDIIRLLELLTKRLGQSEVNHLLKENFRELRLIGEAYGILL